MARMIKVPAWKFTIPRIPSYDSDEPDVFEEMTLQEHLVELTGRIKKMVIGLVAGFIVGAILVRPILDQIVNAAQVEAGLDIRSPSDPITIFFRIALYVAVGITLPNIIYQLVAFLAPGLTRKEKRVLFTSLPFMSLLFIGGVSYAYFFAIPRALDFLSDFLGAYIDWNIDAQETISFYMALMMASSPPPICESGASMPSWASSSSRRSLRQRRTRSTWRWSRFRWYSSMRSVSSSHCCSPRHRCELLQPIPWT
jgi:hypothetical protein